MDESSKRPDIGDVIQLVSANGDQVDAIVMDVADNGELVIQMENGETFQIQISPE